MTCWHVLKPEEMTSLAKNNYVINSVEMLIHYAACILFYDVCVSFFDDINWACLLYTSPSPRD